MRLGSNLTNALHWSIAVFAFPQNRPLQNPRVDVLSNHFDDITRALLERQGRRRLIGFMGAAAVGAAAAATATNGGRHRKMSSASSLSSLTVSEPAAAAPPQPLPSPADTEDASRTPAPVRRSDDSSATLRQRWPHGVGGFAAEGHPTGAAAAAAVGAGAGADAGQHPTKGEERGCRRRRGGVAGGDVQGPAHGPARLDRGEESLRGGERGGTATEPSAKGEEAGDGEAVSEAAASAAGAGVGAGAAFGRPGRGRSSSFASLPSRHRPGAVELQRRAPAHSPRPGNSGGRLAANPDEGQRFEDQRASMMSARALGSSWDSAASTGRVGTAGFGTRGRGGRPLDGSRGESLQRSLAEAMEVRVHGCSPQVLGGGVCDCRVCWFREEEKCSSVSRCTRGCRRCCASVEMLGNEERSCVFRIV